MARRRTAVRVSMKLNRSRLAATTTAVRALSVNNAARATAQRARDNIVAKGRVNTGLMRDSVHVTRARNAGADYSRGSVSIIGKAAAYAGFQESGTQAHGPVSAPFLVFQPKGSKVVVFAKRVRGVEPAWFMRDAYRALSVRDFLP